MQVFICYKNVLDTAKAMWVDQKRYNCQIKECKQILRAIEGAKGWRGHPCTKMYAPYKEWLKCYFKCFEAYRHYMRAEEGTLAKLIWEYEYLFQNEEANKLTPPFLTDEFCDQHKRRLYTKAKELYPQFAEYGTSDINFYVVDGELLKYKDGKRI